MSSTTSEVVRAPQEPKPELIVIFKTTPVARVTGRGLVASSEDVSSVNEVLTRHNASLKLLFGQDEARLRAQQAEGWGQEVTTTGYGSLQGGVSQDIWYTDTFNGTSSASPIVTGAVLSAQGARRARGKRLLTSHEFRALLRTTGSPQQAGPAAPVSQRIGNRPNLRQLIPAALARP
ncbi:hypothetical protein MAPG_01445 [Magnaporthiopsis poae ATCC 64411]|uniref:Peptidase S8/S53 domain-containing protein n=1 Tax=Magnaporthiopsis poae (strain ATCC 64411 / 73-15) TaxID=644358 RepID=A0A0C4DNQ1_MAGP6|nr:hypothetical protein MAPG_01445 [Magnaporthiopsis poae ATCC 64411]